MGAKKKNPAKNKTSLLGGPCSQMAMTQQAAFVKAAALFWPKM